MTDAQFKLLTAQLSLLNEQLALIVLLLRKRDEERKASIV